MANENAILNDEDILNEEVTESIDFDELEEKFGYESYKTCNKDG